MQSIEIYEKQRESAAKCKNFHPNLGLCVAVVVSYLELHATPDEVDVRLSTKEEEQL